MDMCTYVAINGIYAKYFSQPFPARTTIAAAALPLGACVEIDLVVKTCGGAWRPHRGDIGGSKMQILIVGVGALGGTIAARAVRAGLPVRLAARNTDSASA